MIWVAGRIVGDDELNVSVLDRTFEHGLGLFETLRTWNGRPRLLARHLERLRDSARILGLPFDQSSLPNAGAVEALVRAESLEGDVMLRITMSAGRTQDDPAVVWMRASSLPVPLRHDGAAVIVGGWHVARDDALARYKTLNYWARRRASEAARNLGIDESLSTSPDGIVWEGSRTNLFLLEGDALVTPKKTGPIVPGIMRQRVLDLALDLPLAVREWETVTPRMLFTADEVFLTNSVRGIVPVASAYSHEAWPSPPTRWSVPGPWTQRLSLLLADWLGSDGEETP